MRRKVITTIILILILAGAGAAIYVGIRLSQDTTAPQNSSAFEPSKQSAQGACTANCANTGCSWGGLSGKNPKCCTIGSNCNTVCGYSYLQPGQVWVCELQQGQVDVGYCVAKSFQDLADSGNNCFLSCAGGTPHMAACGCPTLSECQNSCVAKAKSEGQTSGRFEYTGTCSNCGQGYKCDCTLVDSPTSTPTPTITLTPTTTSTPIPTPTRTITPTVTDTITPTVTSTPALTPTRTITPTVTGTTIITPTTTTTPTITPTRTTTPTVTPTVTGTQVITNTPTGVTITPTTKSLPPTALISDKVDRLLLGLLMVIVGIGIYYRTGAGKAVKQVE